MVDPVSGATPGQFGPHEPSINLPGGMKAIAEAIGHNTPPFQINPADLQQTVDIYKGAIIAINLIFSAFKNPHIDSDLKQLDKDFKAFAEDPDTETQQKLANDITQLTQDIPELNPSEQGMVMGKAIENVSAYVMELTQKEPPGAPPPPELQGVQAVTKAIDFP